MREVSVRTRERGLGERGPEDQPKTEQRPPLALGGRRFLLSLAIVAACVSLALGISLPIIKLPNHRNSASA